MALFRLLSALLLPLLVAAGSSFGRAAGAVLPSGPHIADLTVLLPPRMTNPVEYRLQASGGCFSWSWDHHDILFVQPEYNNSNRCSTSARLVSIAPYEERKETAVYATDLHSGTVIRCEVFIDMIARIKIFHHSLKLDLHGLATLRIHGFDNEDNVFSSLVGLQFLWQLLPKSVEVDGIHNLVHIPLKDTPLSECGHFCGGLETRTDLEERGIGSDLYVVKGIGIGHEVVTAKLLEPQLDQIVDEIVLIVAEAMSIDPPSPVFITVGATINYRLRIIHLNVPQVIDLPSPNHRWYAVNTSVARVDSVMGIAHSLNLGVTNIVVEDSRVSGHVQTSTMHVVVPTDLRLYILPVTSVIDPIEGARSTPSSVVWYVFPGQEYIIYAKAYSEGYEAKELHITESNKFKLESNKVDYWKLFSVSDSFATFAPQNSRMLKPISPGQGFLVASITYYSGKSDVTEVLKVMQEVIVCSKVKLLIREKDEDCHIIRLPWAPGVYQEIKLKASGGCAKMMKDYSWYSSDMDIVSASASGLVRAKRPGQAVIKVVSVFDPSNYDEILIEVSVPFSMIMVPFFPVEAVVGTELEAAVTLQTSNGTYSRCDAFSNFVRWQVFSENESFKFVNTSQKPLDSGFLAREGYEPLYSPPCAWTYLYAAGVGRAVLHATLSIELQSSAPSSDKPLILKAATSVAAYSPLVVQQAGNGNQYGGYWVDLRKAQVELQDTDYKSLEKLYLVPGSGMDILLLGGPERWDKKVEYIKTVEVLGNEDQSEAKGLLVQQESDCGGRLYRVLCGTLGTFKLLFSRGNLVADDHPVPAIANVELSVMCSFPSSITLIANEPAGTPDVIEAAIEAARGPGRIRISPVIVTNGCTIRVAATGIHSSNTAFANSSSLCLRWELSGCEELAHWEDMKSFDGSGPTWERFLVLQNASGLCTVRATVIGFSETMASHVHEKASQLLEHAENNLTDTLRLQLVSRLRVIPDFVLLVYYPDAKANLSVTGGTCFLDAVTNDTQVVQINQAIESLKCSHLMLTARGLGSAVVTIRDVALSPPATASVEVRVANVNWINIDSPEEISLMEGTTKEFDILAGTQDGIIFDFSQYMFMDMHVHIEDGILDLVSWNDSSKAGNWVLLEPKFSVKASQLGTATLYVSVRLQSGHDISSQFVKVEVYKPLKVHPDYIYLVPGASYVITVEGGPKNRAFGEYSSMNTEKAMIETSSGRVAAISAGNATVRATIYGNGGSFICEAYGVIEVGIPSALSLNLQSDKLCVGCRMPIYPSFSKGTLFSFYEICNGYKWMVEDDQVLSFQMARSLTSDVDRVPLSHSEEKSSLYYRDDAVIGFINMLLGRSAGRTMVSISFSCDFVSSGSPQTVVYNASKSIRVVADPPLAIGIAMTWVIPPYYITSDLLPASTESEGLIDSQNRRQIVYTLLKTCGTEYAGQDAITIDGSKIRTKESNNLACIQAKDQTTGRIEIASCVRVAEVAQLRATTTQSPFHLVYLAVNAKVELVVKYCDNVGYPFYEAHGIVPLEIETNYPDILALLKEKPDNGTETNNDSIFLQAIKPGRALVRIAMDQNPRKADFILVSVGAQVFPMNPIVHVGHYLNFSIVGDETNSLRSGLWSSSNGSILQINRKSGEAHARHEGAVQVNFKGSDFNMQTVVIVLKVDEISVEAPSETISNVQVIGGYEFPVRISAKRFPSNTFEATGSHLDVPYDCKVDPSHVGFAKPWSDLRAGNLYCLFFPYTPKHLLSSLTNAKAISSKERDEIDELVYVTIIASLNEAPHVMGSARALFFGGFSIVDGGKLNLTPSFNRSLITIVGNTDVEIHWNAKDLLSVRLLSRDDFGMVGRLQYEVKVLKQQKFSDKLTVVLPAIGQTEEVDVNYEIGEATSPVGKSGITWVAVLLCGVVLVLTVLVFIRLLDKTEMPGPPREAGTTSPLVTQDPNAAASGQSSPRTPPPFMDYVRRTIDETPYYKRNGRRRFDPQYTY